ncbi:acetyl-CoA C-acyltransferase [Domibacillus epiphyticus]|uniref:Acetyl-CoA acetyltransferase n=1 Tax=Domibacillus epiphyticus TaxID=1714355 RepID=A0A1V2A8V7_9BACI|nr:acetyl-CoA C-acyltransferase [Domibacillus epiphyticus]OMP67254.1 acetyl-CoA acetyltransferase [Domibacillus epiphyticus]
MSVYITGAYRTPVGIKNGMFKEIGAAELAAPVIKTLYANLDSPPDEVILGNVTGPGGNIARLSALLAGLPDTVPGLTVDRQCSSGLEAIRIGASLIHSGQADLIIAGGCESSSTSPRPEKAIFSPDYIGDPEMGIAAEWLAAREHISRKEQDDFAIRSYKRYYESYDQGFFQNEVIPVHGIKADESAVKKRPIEKMAGRAKAAFQTGGTVTAINSSAHNDAACAVTITSKANRGLKIIGSAAAGADPNFPAATPVPAIKKLLQQTCLTPSDIDLWEINEAFAVKILYTARELTIPLEKINVFGGGIALGHPYGASGAMLALRLFYGMPHKLAKYGVAAVGSAGGIGVAMLFEYVN